jgi:hypothetical protein
MATDANLRPPAGVPPTVPQPAATPRGRRMLNKVPEVTL